jgi:selenocysteine lyase/cysteine desulfurase
MTLSELRNLFPHTHQTVYLNHAAIGPLSRRVMDALGQYLDERHQSHVENWFDFQQVLDETCRRIATLIGTTADRVEFASNTSMGLNVLAQGFPWQPGDRIAVPGCEFPANVYPFLNLQHRGVEVDFIPHHQGTFTVADVEAVLTPRTRLLTVSAVQFLSGFRADLAALGTLCRDRGVFFCVDAIQALGALRVDVEACGIDFLACGGHKWLMAEPGIGFLYLHPRTLERLHPWAGWLHGPVDWDHLDRYELAFHPDARRFRTGNVNCMGVAALHAALGLYAEVGHAWAEAQVLARVQQLADGLARMGLVRFGSEALDHASGIVTVQHPRPEAAFEYLKQRGIRIALRNRLLRFAPTWYNNEEEIETTLHTLNAFGRS